MTDQPCAPGISPYLTVSDAAGAIEFYKTVLGAQERMRQMAEDGRRVLHADLAVNGGTVMLSDEFPEYGCGGKGPDRATFPPVAISLALPSPAEVDRLADRAKQHGASVEMGPMDAFWGARFAVFRDPFGHRWMLNASA